jgi:glycosyltransferase involved in cell wall biosynthesis
LVPTGSDHSAYPKDRYRSSRRLQQAENTPVSVVIPLFNKEDTIVRAAQSVPDQGESALEVIVVDDGSTDSGPMRIEQLAHPKLRLLRQPNRGPGYARNRGLSQARAPFVCFLDADDELLDGALERAVRALREHDDCAACVQGLDIGEDRRGNQATFAELGIGKGTYRVSPDLPAGAFIKLLTLLHSSCTVCRTDAV